MKFAHFPDMHLGKRTFKLKEREEDFKQIFKQAIDKAIEEKVEFIVQPGDLFDVGKPDIDTMIFCAHQLLKLKDAGIPFFVVPGSHDIGYGETRSILSLFDKAGLLQNVGSIDYLKEKDGKFYLTGLKYKDAFICGISGRKSRIKDIYSNLVIDKPEKSFGIFLFHQAVSTIKGFELYADINQSLLPDGFDYYAGGHWHGLETMEYKGKPLIYPGSIENGNINEMERNDKKGFFIYEDGNLKFVELDSRPIIVKEIFSKNISAEELMQKCLNEIEEVKEGEKPILIIKLKGRLNDKRGEINKTRIVGKAVEKGYLHANISLSELKEKDEALIEIESKNADQLEEEYLKKKNYNEREIDLARKIMNTLGDDLTQKELEERNFSFIKLLKGWINEN